MSQSKVFRTECKHWVGRRPCLPIVNEITIGCDRCSEFTEVTHNICIIRGSNLGGVVRNTGMARSIKEALPASNIVWVAKSSAVELIEACEYVDLILCLDRPEDYYQLLSFEFDCCINFDPSEEFRAACKAVSSRAKIGFATSPLGQMIASDTVSRELIHYRVAGLEYRNTERVFQRIFHDALAMAFPNTDMNYHEYGVSNSHTVAHDQPRAISYELAVNVGSSSNWETKRWPLENYFSLIEKYLEINPESKCAIISGPDEAHLFERISEFVEHRQRVDSLNGTIGDLIKILPNIETVVSGDTFVAHLSMALDLKTVVIFGSTSSNPIPSTNDSVHIKADQQSCWPCNRKLTAECENEINLACLKSISVQQVLKEIIE